VRELAMSGQNGYQTENNRPVIMDGAPAGFTPALPSSRAWPTTTAAAAIEHRAADHHRGAAAIEHHAAIDHRAARASSTAWPTTAAAAVDHRAAVDHSPADHHRDPISR
jgi:hypothetical protein